MYLNLNKFQEAEAVIRNLLKRNPENTLYYPLLERALRVEKDEDKFNLLMELVKAEPKALAPRRLLLNYATGGFLLIYRMFKKYLC